MRLLFALVAALLTTCQLSADLVSTNSRAASEAWVSRRFVPTQDLATVTGSLSSHTGNASIHMTAGQASKIAAAITGEVDSVALSALASFAETNRVTSWKDATNPYVYWQSFGGTQLVATATHYLHTGTLFYFQPGADSVVGLPYPVGVTNVIPFTVGEEGYWNGATNLNETTIAIGYFGEIQMWTNDYSESWPITLYPNESSFLAPQGTAIAFRGSLWVEGTNIVGVYNLTTGNVWQAVTTAQAHQY